MRPRKSLGILLLIILCTKAYSQTFSFNTWTAGSFSYTKTAGSNTMTVTYTESGNYRGNTTSNTSNCFGTNTTSYPVPFYYNEPTMYVANYSSGSCYCANSAAQSGLVLAANWPNQTANWEQIVISFANPVCAANFNIWDINQDFWSGDGSTYFTDKVDISATDANSAAVPAANITIGSCGANTVGTSGSTKTITAVNNGCGCGSTSVNITGPTVKTITLRYWNGGSTYSADPWSQYIIISSVVATAAPTAGINAPALACGATTNTLTATTSASSPTYQWTGPGGSSISSPTASVTTVNGAGVYTLTINPGGCSSTATYTLTPGGTPPDLTLGANSSITCSSNTTTVSASSTTPGATYSWSGTGITSGGGSSIATVNQAGTFTVTVSASGCTNTGTVSVTSNTTTPGVTMGSIQSINCSVTTATVTGSSITPGVIYTWSGPGTISPNNSTSGVVSTGGTYTLTVTNPINSCVSTGTIQVTSNISPPNVSMGSNTNITCTNTTTTVSGSSSTVGATYNWSTGVVPGNTANGTVSANGVYTLTVTNPSNGCVNTGTVSVSTNTTVPNINMGSNTSITCMSTTATVSGSSSTGGATYNWSAGVVPGNTASGSVSANGVYTLTVTNPSNGCVNTGTVSVSTNTTVPNISMGSNSSITCASSTASVSGSSSTGGATYNWSAGVVPGNTANGTVSSSGIYTLTVTNPTNGCISTGTINVSSNLISPDINSGPNQVLTCLSNTATITGNTSTPGATFSWSNGVIPGNTASGTVNASGNYTLTVTNPLNGCTATTVVSVTSNTIIPNITVNPATSITCLNSTSTVSGSSSNGNVSYSWSAGVNPSNSSSGVVSAAGNYTLTVTDNVNGCINTAVVNVSSNTIAPNVSIQTANNLTCSTATLTLSGNSSTSGVNYQWSSGVSPSNSSSGTVSTAGTYTLTVVDPSNGCTNSATVVVSSNTTPPNISVGNSQTLTCSISSVTISGSSSTPGANFYWEGPGAGTSAGTTPNASSTNVSSAGVYTLTVTDPTNGCVSFATVSVIPDSNLPNVTATANQVISCINTSASVNGSSSTPNVTYSWSNGVTPGNTANGTVTSPGTYTLTVTDPLNGCSSNTAVTVASNTTIPNAGASSSTGTITCNNPTINLVGNSTTPNVTFSWSNGVIPGNTASGSVSNAGSYTLTVTDPNNGCFNDQTVITVSIDTIKPNANAGNNQFMNCSNPTATLSGSSTTPNVSYSWSSGVNPGNNASGTVTIPGTYTLTVTDLNNGCTDTSTVQVLLNGTLPNISVNSSSNAITCTTGSIILTGTSSNNNLTYSWTGPTPGTPAGTSPSFSTTTVSAAGTYTLTVVDPSSGCSNSTSISVTTQTISPIINASSNNINCLVTNANVSVNSNISNPIINWSNGVTPSNGVTGSVNMPGTYTVSVTDPGSGCSSVATVTVNIDTVIPVITINTTGSTILDCSNNVINLNANANGTSSIQWFSSAGLINGNPINVSVAGTYTAVAVGNNGCSDSSSITVAANTTVPVANAVASTDTLSCAQPFVNLTGSPSSGSYTYSWTGPSGFNSNTANVNNVQNPGTYIFTVVDTVNNCTAHDTIIIVQGSNPIVGFNFTPNGGTAPQLIQFNNTSTSGFNSYYWNFGNGDTSTSINPNTTYGNGGVYTITLIGYGINSQCNDTIAHTITLDEEVVIEVPNVFTPNGDAINDFVFIKTKGIRDLQVDIFNRWGQLIYQIFGVNGKWNGDTNQNGAASDGTYYFILKATDFNGKEYNNHGYILLAK